VKGVASLRVFVSVFVGVRLSVRPIHNISQKERNFMDAKAQKEQDLDQRRSTSVVQQPKNEQPGGDGVSQVGSRFVDWPESN
jgi:hypothetical protein